MNVDLNQTFAQLRQILGAHKREIEALQGEIKNLRANRSVQQEIDAIPGRRVFHSLVGSQTFTASQDGVRGSTISITVSQDGPFVMTHYPFVAWRSSLPSNATDLGRWRPVSTWPLADQVIDTNIVDLSYEMFDGGSERAMQNSAVPPMLSRPDQMHPLPIPTLFTPNSTIQFIPTYHNVLFNDSTATTEGTLVVALPGYRIVNM